MRLSRSVPCVYLRPVTMTSLVGVKVDGTCHLLREDGSVIENLFGAGNMIFGGQSGQLLCPGSRRRYRYLLWRFAAQTAKAEIQAQ